MKAGLLHCWPKHLQWRSFKNYTKPYSDKSYADQVSSEKCLVLIFLKDLKNNTAVARTKPRIYINLVGGNNFVPGLFAASTYFMAIYLYTFA